MASSAPWYTKLWKADRGGTRTTVAICGYLLAGVLALGLAATGDVVWMRIAWAVVGSAQTFLGTTLLATVLRHRRSHDTADVT
jgi:hypothetical protein